MCLQEERLCAKQREIGEELYKCCENVVKLGIFGFQECTRPAIDNRQILRTRILSLQTILKVQVSEIARVNDEELWKMHISLSP